ncbi:uncharacterized protein LOC110989579 [Acanthaster planci]|uniref:Uncharacterized protein LOC110989579 n=1 Tax=Acanthaster planci TaxID=133434 RepID=A0A8B7ZWH0_ACAPL|nr:uncharacterized protein LOC110989579 [Acanthaster planci]
MNQDHVNLSLLRAHSSRVPTKATPTCEFSKTLSSSRGRLYGESKMNPVRLASAFILVLVGGMWMNVTVEGRTVFLERGQRGIIPCPTVQSQELSRGSLDGAYVYWYFSNTEPLSLLISLFRGRVEPQNEIPEGVYDIDGNFSLVIENVTDSNAGTFFCRIKPREEAQQQAIYQLPSKV